MNYVNIQVSRDNDDDQWYIVVHGEDGGKLYDGLLGRLVKQDRCRSRCRGDARRRPDHTLKG